VDDLSTGHAEALSPNVTLNQFDIGNRFELEHLLSSKTFDVVFHFAAKALIAESVVNPGLFFQSNLVSAITMLETLRKHGVHKFVFSSSAAVYGSPTVVPILEDHVKDPVNAYGESKLMLERVLQWYASAYGWSVVVFRYFNACGGGASWGERHDPETHVIPLLLQAASGRREVFEVYGDDYPTPDGTCLRDYVHVMDIAEAHILALKKMDTPGFHVYNIGTGWSYSVREVWRAVEEVTHKKVRVHQGPRRPGDPAILCACPEKLMNEFGWNPEYSDLREIIRGAWEWEQVQSNSSNAVLNAK
jgi:UDP-glucose 4-epimerase